RLERLQRVVSKLQMESGLCEEQLNQADALLQADIRLLAAGKAPQKAAEVERDLDKADAMIRLLFNDVQSLKDGRHPQGEQMYRRGALGGPHTHDCSPPGPALPWLPPSTRPPGTCQPGPASVPQPPEPPVPTHVPCVLHSPAKPPVPPMLTHAPMSPVPSSCPPWPPHSPSPPWSPCALKQEMMGRCVGREEGTDPPPLCPPQNSSKSRLRHLESLHSFVSQATKELLWLSEKEEEEVTFDWSHHNPNMAAKKDNYS
ncbi:PLEC protein, partial [Bucco capensis]|nr:PLEC protein [Bucco capensis]